MLEPNQSNDCILDFSLGVCEKPKFGSDLDKKNPNQIQTVQKYDIHAEGFPIIQCADKERFKTRLKHSLVYRFYNAITLLTCCRYCK